MNDLYIFAVFEHNMKHRLSSIPRNIELTDQLAEVNKVYEAHGNKYDPKVFRVMYIFV